MSMSSFPKEAMSGNQFDGRARNSLYRYLDFVKEDHKCLDGLE
jgi:hypothetical protein